MSVWRQVRNLLVLLLVVHFHSLLWPGIEDAVAEGAEADGRVVVGLSAVVEVDFEQADVVPDRGGDGGDEEED